MKFTTKRLLSVLLCLAMVLAMLPMAVFAETTYTVAGDAGLCGTAWEPTLNPMTANDNGTYSITFQNVAAGTYGFKVTNGSWNASWGDNGTSDGNYQVTLDTASDVTISFDPNNGGAIAVVGDGIAKDYHLVGTVTDWNAGDATKMVKDGSVYKLTVNVAAGNHQYKVNDGTWNISWGDPNTTSKNFEFTLEADTDVTFTFDPATATITAAGEGLGEVVPEPMVIEKVIVAGDAALTGSNWDPADINNQMIDVENVYTMTYTDVAAGTYEFKFAANGSWDIQWSYGDVLENTVQRDAYFCNQNNTKVTVDEDGSTVILTLNLTNVDLLNGSGALCDASIIAPAKPGELALGDNEVTPGTFTFTAPASGKLTVSVPSISFYDEYTSAWTEVSPMMFGRAYTLLVNGITNFTPSNELVVIEGDVITIELANNMGYETQATINLTLTDAPALKFQLNTDASLESETVKLRLLTGVDSLDYQNVTFTVTIGDQSVDVNCDTVYTQIKAAGTTIESASKIFGSQAAYFATHTLEVDNADLDTDITVTVSWTTLDGEFVVGQSRTVNIADVLSA